MYQFKSIKLNVINRKTARVVMLLFVLFSVSSIAIAQNSTVKEVKEACVKALKNNDIDAFVKTFSDPIEIALPDEENSYSKTQASMVIRKFLQKNKLQSFNVKQTGKSTGGAEFIIGEMITTTGAKYQVYMLITLIDSKAYLHLIEFELI